MNYVLPFIGGNHPFSQADLEAIEVAAVLLDVENEKKKKETFQGIFKTYLPLWVISIDGSNGIMVDALILSSEQLRTRRFDKAIELDPERDLASGSIADFITKLRLYESKITDFQKESKFELKGYIHPTIASDIRVLFENIEQKSISNLVTMSQRLTEQSAIMMCEPLISVFHVNVQKILQDLYQIPIIVNTQLQQLFDELGKVASDYVNKVQELKQKINTLEEGDSYKNQERKVEILTNEFLSFRDMKDRSMKKLRDLWDEINSLSEKIQHGYLQLISSVFETKNRILELGTPFPHATQRGEAVLVLLPIYIAMFQFQEKKSRIAYFPPYILNFAQKKELSITKGFEMLKRQFEHQYSNKVPPGVSEVNEYNLLFSPSLQQMFNDGVHKLRETKIINSKTYVRIMDAYNEFFLQAQPPPKSRL